MCDMIASVIIRAYNEARHLPALLGALSQQTLSRQDFEIIVIDSGSSDSTPQIARDGGCRLLEIPKKEFSFGRSLNLGCEAATGRQLVFISAHCLPVDGHWLAHLIAPLEKGEAALAYGRQIGGKDSKFSECKLFERYFPPNHEEPAYTFFCNNANAAMPRELWAQYRFNEVLTGLEDMHMAKRLHNDNHKIQYVPQACVYHFHNETWAQVQRRYEREALALRGIVPEVEVSRMDALRYFLAGVFFDWSKAIDEKCFFEKASEIVAFRFCQYYGAWRGNHIHKELTRQAKERYFYPC